MSWLYDYMNEKHFWCRADFQIDVWRRPKSLLNLLGVKTFSETFFSLTLGPHHHRVLVFPRGNVFRTLVFLLASCSFCFHWLLVSGYIRDRLCLWSLTNFHFGNLKIVLCIAGAIYMDDCLWANVSSWKPCLYTWWFWPR